MLRIYIKCPVCFETKDLSVMIKSLKMNKEGLTSIYIDSGQVCSH